MCIFMYRSLKFYKNDINDKTYNHIDQPKIISVTYFKIKIKVIIYILIMSFSIISQKIMIGLGFQFSCLYNFVNLITYICNQISELLIWNHLTM